MNHREALFITEKVRPWILKHSDKFKNIVFEAKETENTICDNDFEPQQLPSLEAASAAFGLYCKIPDGSGIATPFDGFHIANAKAFVAIEFRDKGWVMIDYEKWKKKTVRRIGWDAAKDLTNFWYRAKHDNIC